MLRFIMLLFIILRPIMFSFIMLQPIMFLYIMLPPIMLFFTFSLIMSWPIMSEDLSIMPYMLWLDDISFIWCLCIMLFEDISRPIMLYMFGFTLESSLREEESMKEVILVWMSSGSTERLILS